MINYLSQIKLTHYNNIGDTANSGNGSLITMYDLYCNHRNNLSGFLQCHTKGERLKQIGGSERYIIEFVDGLIFIDIDNHGQANWPQERTLEIAHQLNEAFNEMDAAGYLWTEISKSGNGIHVFFYIPLTAIGVSDRYKEYYVNAGLTYNKIFKQLVRILPELSKEQILEKVLDFHNFSLVQPFEYAPTTILLNQRYNQNIDNFNNFCENIADNYANFTKYHGDYTNALKMADVEQVFADAVNKRLFGDRKDDIVTTEISYSGVRPSVIEPIEDAGIVFDYNKRLQLVWTLRNFFGVEETIDIATRLYDLYHNTDSNRAKAVRQIQSAASSNENRTPNNGMIVFLQRHGFVINSTLITLHDNRKEDFFGIEGTGINGLPADETINLADGFVTDYYDNIISKLNEHQNVYIKAGCGVGKSTFFRTLIEKEKKVCIVCHLNSIKEGVYGKREQEQAQHSEMDIMQNLFEPNFQEEVRNYLVPPEMINMWIATKSRFINDKMVVSWDGYQRLIENGYAKVLDDYIKCIDESHNIVAALNYRNRKSSKKQEGTISALANTKYHFGKTIFCTGTPQNEYQLYQDIYKFEFQKKDPVKYTWEYFKIGAQVSGRGSCEKGAKALYKWFTKYVDVNAYDRIMVYTNTFSGYFTDYLRKNGTYDFCYFCRDNSDMGDQSCGNILFANDLQEEIIVSTVYGSQGIEIKNRIEKLLCVFVTEGTTRTDIIQTIHRFRNIENVHSVICEIHPQGIPEKDLREFSKAVGELRSIPEDKRELLKSNKNYFATKTLMRDNVGYGNNDIVLAELYYNYLQSESLTLEKAREWFDPYMVFRSEIFQDDGDIEDDISVDAYKRFLTENINHYIEYSGIVKYDAFLGTFLPDYKPTRYEEKHIERDLEAMKEIKYLVSPHDENYADTDTRAIMTENVRKIVHAFTYSKSKKSDDEKIFRISACLSFLKARNRIHKHLLSRGIYLGNQLNMDDTFVKEKLVEIRDTYFKHARRLGIDDMDKVKVIDGMFDFSAIPNLESGIIEPNYIMLSKHENWQIDSMGRASSAKLKFQLKSDSSVRFSTHEETYSYATDVLHMSISKSTWVKNGKWKEYFDKL